jgi:hypothetical protein
MQWHWPLLNLLLQRLCGLDAMTAMETIVLLTGNLNKPKLTSNTSTYANLTHLKVSLTILT